MRWLLALLAACGPSWDGTWSDGVHAPLIARTCGDDSFVVFSFNDRNYAGSLLDGNMVAPFLEPGHAIWSGYLRLAADSLYVQVDNNSFTATRTADLDDLAGDCATLAQ